MYPSKSFHLSGHTLTYRLTYQDLEMFCLLFVHLVFGSEMDSNFVNIFMLINVTKSLWTCSRLSLGVSYHHSSISHLKKTGTDTNKFIGQAVN